MSTKIHDLKEILDMVNTPGGHIVISIALGVVGTVLGGWATWLAWPDEKLAVIFAGMTGAMTSFFSVAMYAMRGQDKANGAGKTEKTTTETIETRKEEARP